MSFTADDLQSAADRAGLLTEVQTADPSAPSSGALFYAYDNGGTTELRVIFSDGTITTLADDS